MLLVSLGLQYHIKLDHISLTLTQEIKCFPPSSFGECINIFQRLLKIQPLQPMMQSVFASFSSKESCLVKSYNGTIKQVFLIDLLKIWNFCLLFFFQTGTLQLVLLLKSVIFNFKYCISITFQLQIKKMFIKSIGPYSTKFSLQV